MAKHKEFEHKDLKEPDAFFESFGRARRYYEENRRLAYALAAATLVIFIAGVAWSSYSESRAERTAAAFMRATDAIDLDSPATAMAALETVSKRSGGSTYGRLAVLYRADVMAREGNCAEAIELYRDAQNTARAAFVRQVAAMGAGYCLETTVNPAEAAAAYAQAARMEGPYREQALRGQLRAAVSANDNALATAALESILEDFPETPDAEELSQKLAALGG